jgi:uridine phosphorylase
VSAPDAPILEFDASPTAVIEPSAVVTPDDVPSRVVLCFFLEVIERIAARPDARVVTTLRAEHGTHSVWQIDHDGRHVAVAHPGVGAPLAAGFLEELIAHGCTTFIACGGAGGLVPELTMGHVVVPTSAVRDEGTSYHYLAPSREVGASPIGTRAIVATLERHGVPHVLGKTWTTDAPYRETRGKVARRVSEGCLTVEMEAAAFFAVAEFRGVTFGQLLYAGDDLSGDTWDDRGWQGHADGRDQLFWLAVESVLAL